MEAWWTYASKLISLGDVREGEQIYRKIERLTERVEDKEEIDYSKVIEAKWKLAHFYEARGEKKEALKLYEECAKMAQQELQANHDLTEKTQKKFNYLQKVISQEQGR